MASGNKARFAPTLLAALITLPFLSDIALARLQAHTLQGKVYLPNNVPPPNPVKVTLFFSGMRVHETFTDLSGRFSFSGLRRGVYEIRAEGDGEMFETATVRSEVLALGNAPQTFTQNVQLRLKPGRSLPAAAVVSAEESDARIPERAKKEYDQGLKRARDNKPDQAIKHFQAAVLMHPQYYSAFTAMAEQHAKLEDIDGAIAAYRKAIEIKSDRADAYTGIGVLLVKQKRYVEALPLLRRSIELDNRSQMAYLFLGLAEMFTNDYVAAEADLLKAYDMGKQALVRLYLANLYDLRGEPARAIDHLQGFLRESPNLAEERKVEIREVIDKLRKQIKEGK
jgi:Tfp pilus assembly protein PilF